MAPNTIYLPFNEYVLVSFFWWKHAGRSILSTYLVLCWAHLHKKLIHCMIYKDTLLLYIFTFRTFDLVYDLSLFSFRLLYPDCSISFHVLDNFFSVKPNSKLLVQKFHKLLFIRFLLLFVFFNHFFLLLKFGYYQVLFSVQCIILFLHLFLFIF